MSAVPGDGLRVLHGNPDATEVAALVAVLLTRARRTAPPGPAGNATERAEWERGARRAARPARSWMGGT
ncbi:acyl-CoA carboxylase subunit epsilon [Streptomyces sp. NPDC002055]|uniref:acyl-CoA carboxylase subunit epsilon n=1 Tax=Streptomyces sp. NPDC002055 TaxID=3154534 RepID=UPI00333156EE